MSRKIGVLMGGPSSEREVSLESGRNVLAALRSRGHDAVGIEWLGGDIAPLLAKAGIDVVWNALHGTYGEDGCVQGALEILGIPYTGSGVLASALAMDKVASKRLFEYGGLRVPKWQIVKSADEVRSFGLPCVLKPSREGSSVGVSIVKQEKEIEPALAAARRGRGVPLIEEYVHGREISVGILDDQPLGTVEIRPHTDFYDYAAKYTRDDTEYFCPAPLPHAVEQEVMVAALKAHSLLSCRCYSRVDFLVTEDGTCFLLEVNTLPGMTSHSLVPKMAAQAGIDYATLCERILASASLTV